MATSVITTTSGNWRLMSATVFRYSPSGLADSRASRSFSASLMLGKGAKALMPSSTHCPDFVDHAVGREAVDAGHRLHFHGLVLAFDEEEREDEIVGGEAGFLHHVADDFGLAVAAGAVGGEHISMTPGLSPERQKVKIKRCCKSKTSATKFSPKLLTAAQTGRCTPPAPPRRQRRPRCPSPAPPPISSSPSRRNGQHNQPQHAQHRGAQPRFGRGMGPLQQRAGGAADCTGSRR